MSTGQPEPPSRARKSQFLKSWKKILSILIVVLLAASLASWTLLSPKYMTVQSGVEDSNSLFQYASSRQVVNFSDAGGSYGFLFGLDYNRNVSAGVPTIVEVYASLISQQKSSGFMRGVALQVTAATVLIDGVEDEGVKIRFTSNSAILIYYLTGVQVNETEGLYSLSVRLVVSTVDVDYVGYFSGNEEVVSLNGTLSVFP
jgi:hypothetical protein